MRKRILLLITDLEIGGTPTVVRELAIRLQPFAHVEVACLKPAGPVADQLRQAGVAVRSFDAISAIELPKVVARLARLICDQPFDTVFSFLLHANATAAGALALCPGVRGLQSIQTIQPSPSWHWTVQGLIASRADRIVAPSSAIIQAAVDRSGLDRGRFVVIPNAVDPSEFSPHEVFTGDRVRAGYLGRLDSAKRPALLIDMMTFASADVELHFFGEGPDRQRMESAARQSSARERIYFHGAIDSPQRALSQMDVLLLPSDVEGFGLVLIEAMAAGVPVIACAAGGVVEVVEDGRNGILIPPSAADFQPADFARAIKTIQSDTALRSALIKSGLQTVRDRFRWSAVLPRYRRLLNLEDAA